MAGEHVLLIENDALQREALASELRRQGFSVDTAAGADLALARLSGGPAPDVVLLDMLLADGERDGWWFMDRRQGDPTLAAVPVVILTSLSVASEAWAASLGAAGLLRKPADPAILAAGIRRCLGGAPQG